MKIFWPPSTPIAQTMSGMRGGKGKAKSSNSKDKKKNEEKPEDARSGGGPEANKADTSFFCWRCKMRDTWVDGECVYCQTMKT